MISNASPLIFLAKLNQLEMLKKLFSKVTITEAIKEEILNKDKKEYFIIEKAINDKWIKIINPKNEVNYHVRN